MIKYFAKEESDKYAFYYIPKELFINENYTKMAIEAKLLYGILRDRNELSIENNWVDNEGHIYVIFTRQEAEETLNLNSKVITKAFKELNEFNLIKEKRQGLNKPNLIYVGKIKTLK